MHFRGRAALTIYRVSKSISRAKILNYGAEITSPKPKAIGPIIIMYYPAINTLNNRTYFSFNCLYKGNYWVLFYNC